MRVGLQAQNVSFQRPGRDGIAQPILDRVSIHVGPGQAALIHGATGAGKTTLLHLLVNLMRPTAGEILAEGEPVSRWTAKHRDRWRRKAGIAFQKTYLLNHLTALENVYLPLVPRQFDAAALRRRGLDSLSQLGATRFAGTRPTSLSGGECQRVAIARALVSEPAYLFLDEPTAFQDDAGVRLIFQAIKHAKDKGAVVFICSHDHRLREAELIDATYHLEAGHVRPCSSQTERTATD
jgi:ABC-type lipoprotein export system ATPase subunit